MTCKCKRNKCVKYDYNINCMENTMGGGGGGNTIEMKNEGVNG